MTDQYRDYRGSELRDAYAALLRDELAEAKAKIDRLTSRGIEDLRFSLETAEARVTELETLIARVCDAGFVNHSMWDELNAALTASGEGKT